MTYGLDYDSSPPETPDKLNKQSAWSISTTPAGLPPSSANSFTPKGHPPSTVFNTSHLNSFSQNESSNPLFTQSGGFNTNDSIFGSSFGSDFAMPQPKQTAPATNRFPTSTSQSRFSIATNGSAFGQSSHFDPSNGFQSSQMSEYQEDQEEEDQMEEHEEEEEAVEEDARGNLDLSTRDGTNRLSFLDSTFGKPLPPQAPEFGQRKPIYTNPSDAKRPKLDERWAQQSPIRKTKLSPKKPSAMPSILHTLASRSRLPAVDEPADMIINTEDTVARMFDEMRDSDHRHIDFDHVLSHTANKMAATWDICADRSGISRPYGAGSSIGPGEQAPRLVKATFLASLLLQIHHPSRASAPIATASNPAAAQNSMIKAMQRAIVATPMPQILLDWLNGNHASRTNDLQVLRYVEPNPTASTNFWDIINAAVLRGQFAEAAEILRSADFNYARSALEDGLPQAGYRGIQLQNIQRCVNKALQILDSCPGFQDDDWNITGPDWAHYRKRVQAAVNDLEAFAEGDEKDEPVVPQANRFQAVNFGLGNVAQNSMRFTQSARMAESQVPWAIYQNLRSLYRIILGDPGVIKDYSQDWVEATIGLTAWWDGEDDDGTPGLDLRASIPSNDFSRSRGSRNQQRAVDRNTRDAYLRRLDLAFNSVTNEPSDSTGFRVNTMNSLEVGLASVFEGNVQGVVELVQSWSLCVASGVAEIAELGGWFESSIDSKRIPGLSEDDLMVLSYGQDTRLPTDTISRDHILRSYAFGLYDRGTISNETGSREGWEMALEALSRMRDAKLAAKAVSEVVEKLPLDDVTQLDRLVMLCTELGLEEEGRRVSERYGDMTTSETENYGLALVCYARAHNRRKVKSVVDLLVSYSLVYSRAFPATADLDPELQAIIKEPKVCLSSIASVDEEAAHILQFYLSGYATLRRFYEIRDEAVGLQEGQRPRFKPLARRRIAGKALAAVIGSAADNIYGGLYDPSRDSAVQVDGLLALLGEALVFVNQPAPILSVSEQFTILSAVEDLQTVTSRVYAQCEECFKSTLVQFHSGTAEASAPPAARALLKKSVSALSASTFSLLGNDMMERTQSGPASVGSSGVLVPGPGDKDSQSRGWDWRAALSENTTGADVLQMLRVGLARGLSRGALGSV